ncbi:hypothetical protein Q5X70_08340 [Acinetobacter baumannii]|nr:hypothetical protein [Acinetobacter baumannii]
MDKCREEFEKQRYWIGLFRDAVDFDEELGRYVLNGQRKLYAFHLDSFNEKWAIWQEAWQHQQAKVGELEKHIVDLEQQMLRDSALATKAQMERNALQKKLQSTKESAYKAGFYDGRNGTPCEYVRLEAERDELQKRVDKALELMQKPIIVGEPAKYVCARFKEIEQALKGEG